MVSQSRRTKSRQGSIQPGCLLPDGEGVAKDQVEAVKWFRKAAEQNLAEAQYDLGLCYEREKAWRRIRLRRRNGIAKPPSRIYAKAQYNLGSLLRQRRSVAIKDQMEAVKWFRKAAEQNFAKAQYALGVCYNTGEGWRRIQWRR